MIFFVSKMVTHGIYSNSEYWISITNLAGDTK